MEYSHWHHVYIQFKLKMFAVNTVTWNVFKLNLINLYDMHWAKMIFEMSHDTKFPNEMEI